MIVHHPRTKPEQWSAYAARGWWKTPFLATEYCSDWAVYWLSNWSFLETLEYLSSLSVLIAVIFYFAGTNDRIKMRHYQAWQVINTAQGKGGNGGRIDALQELVEDNVALTGVDVSEAFLQGVHLDHARMMRANFHNADVRNSSFTGADLTDADLNGANLTGADMSGSTLDNADLRNTDLRDIKWSNLNSVKMTNLEDAKNVPPEFLTWALQHGAIQGAGNQAPTKGK